MITNGDVDQFEEWEVNEYCERVPASRPALAAPTRPVVKRGLGTGSTPKMSLRSFLTSLLFDEDVLLARLNVIENKLDQLLERKPVTMADMNQAVNDITTAVATASTVEQSGIALIQGLVGQLQSNKNDPAAIEALAQSLTSQTTALSQAIASGTAAANLGTSTPPSGSGSGSSDTGTGTPPAGSGTPASGDGTGTPPAGSGTSGAPAGGDASGGTPPASGDGSTPPAGSGTPADPTTTTTDTGPTA